MKKLLSKGVLAILAGSLTLSVAAAQAQVVMTDVEPVVVSERIVMSPAGGGYTAPPIEVISGANLELRLLNPTPNDLVFAAPALGVNFVVPNNSERVVYVGPAVTASLTPGAEVAYSILGPDGNQLASGILYSDERLAVVIANAQVPELAFEDEEPVYLPQRATVRGFW